MVSRLDNKERQLYRCNQCCSEFDCPCKEPHELSEECDGKADRGCVFAKVAKCVPCDNKKIVLKKEKPKKIVMDDEE